MQTYSVRDVERVLRLPRRTVRNLIKVGCVRPARGARRAYSFTFQDLIVLRAARTLIDAKVSPRRINQSLRDLRRHLPETVPMWGLSISAIGDRVVVRDGANQYQPGSGQYVLGFDVQMEDGTLHVVDRSEKKGPPESDGVDDWFEKGLALESDDPLGAMQAYERAVVVAPEEAAAWINWGRQLHEQGRIEEAESVYRRGLETCEFDAVLIFNLGVLLEDRGAPQQAIDLYLRAITEDPFFADAHYNLARLYETQGKAQHAIRHLGEYRRLVNAEAR